MTCPIVVVACNRDLPLLELQAQSIHKYLPADSKIYIIVNEVDNLTWFAQFEKFKHYYDNHFLTIFQLDDFDIVRSSKVGTKYHAWAGWDTQQMLKLAIASKISDANYLVVDCQNFLIKEFNPTDYIIKETSPYRISNMSMPKETWDSYTHALGIEIDYPSDAMSICTPIFLKTNLVKDLINSQGSLLGFSYWFNNTAKLKSEFMLYLLWAELHGGIDKHHRQVITYNEWANPYLRDSLQFDKDFGDYINFIGQHKPHKWTSINFRAWGDMSDEQYQLLLAKLSNYGLYPNFETFRAQYKLTYSKN